MTVNDFQPHIHLCPSSTRPSSYILFGMHRLKRAASDVADSNNLNPFCRLRQYRRRRAMEMGRSSTEAMIPPDYPRPVIGDTDQLPVIREQSLAGPTRMRTSNMEEGRPRNSQPNGYYSEKEIEEHKSILGQIKASLFNSWINVLLVFAPIGIATHVAGLSPTLVFFMNFIAIIPLAALLGYASEELTSYCGELLGELLDMSFGNGVKLIVSILALLKGDIVIIQTSLIGSMLFGLVLVLGVTFIAGGFNRIEQSFNTNITRTVSCILTLAVVSLTFPSAFRFTSPTRDAGLAGLSRGTSIILLLVYGSYLCYQLKTHSHLYYIPPKKTPKLNIVGPCGQTLVESSANTSHAVVMGKPHLEIEEQYEHEPDLTLWAALLLTIVSTAIAGICAELLVGSIDKLVTSTGISRVFVGLVLLPIIGNAMEYPAIVVAATRDKMDLSIGIIVGRSMQIVLLIIPFIVILGWILGVDKMTLYFDWFQILSLFISVLLINPMLNDGRSNYFKGILLVALYIIIAIASWFYPEAVSSPTGH